MDRGKQMRNRGSAQPSQVLPNVGPECWMASLEMERRMKIDDVGPNFEHGSTLISYREPVEMQIWWLACLAIRNSETLLNPANP